MMENIFLAEYNSLKLEQLERIKVRDNLIYLALGAFGGLFSFSIAQKECYVTALLPIVSFVLAWVYITNDSRVSQIGRYIENNLSLQVKSKLSYENAFKWETSFKETDERGLRQFVQFITEIMTFIVPSAFSLFFLDLSQDFDNNIFMFNSFLISISFILFCLYTFNKDYFVSIQKSSEVLAADKDDSQEANKEQK